MSNFRDLWGGFVIMVVACFMGLVMALVGGMVLDNVFTGVDDLGWFDEYGNTWDSDWGNMFSLVNLYYFLCALFPIVGIACFVKTVIARQGYDEYLGQ